MSDTAGATFEHRRDRVLLFIALCLLIAIALVMAS